MTTMNKQAKDKEKCLAHVSVQMIVDEKRELSETKSSFQPE